MAAWRHDLMRSRFNRTPGDNKLADAKKPETADLKGMAGTRIKWDHTNMKSACANVCNVTSTREGVVMLFGINQAWNRGRRK
jgi:hypothetical protein